MLTINLVLLLLLLFRCDKLNIIMLIINLVLTINPVLLLLLLLFRCDKSHVNNKSSVAYKDKIILSEGLKILGEKV